MQVLKTRDFSPLIERVLAGVKSKVKRVRSDTFSSCFLSYSRPYIYEIKRTEILLLSLWLK